MCNIAQVIICALIAYANAKIPEYLKVCPSNHENLPKCIQDSIIDLLPKLKVGIPELNIPPLEPLVLDRVSFKSGSDSGSLATNLTDLRVWGASDFLIHYLSVKNTENGKTFRFKVEVPRLYAEGHYAIDTKLMFLELKGEGKFHSNISDYRFDCTLEGNLIVKNEVNHLFFDKLLCQLHVGEKKIHLDNLFENNPILAAATKGIIDDNSDALFNEIKPGLQDALNEKFTNMANQITMAFSYEELFP